MNFYVDARALQLVHWRGQQFYIFRILDEMIKNGLDHTFHLHFGRDAWNPQIDSLLQYSNVVRHIHSGKYWSHASIPIEMFRTNSKIYYRMYNEDVPLYTPLPGRAVALIHDNGKHMHPECYGVTDASEVRKRIARRIHDFAGIITVSCQIKNELIDLFKIDPDKIVVAPNAVNLENKASVCLQRPIALKNDAPFFLVVNPGGANKNWEQTLKGFELYVMQTGDMTTRLVLAGNLAWETDKISSAINSSPILQNQVTCTGYLSDEELRYLYKNARLSVYLSRYEGFGIPILESMAHEHPAIVSDIPVFHEVASDAAYYFPLDKPEALVQALIVLNNDSSLRETLIHRGLTQHKRYSWQESAKITLNALIQFGS